MQALTHLEVYQSGPLTVVGFGGQNLDQLNLTECRQEAFELIRMHGCQTLGVDMTDVRIIPSGLLGLLVAIHREGVSVCLINPSDELREVLEVTKLDRLFPAYRAEN